MSGRYAAAGAQDVTTATPGDSALTIEGGIDQRPQIYDFTSGFGGTPADNAIQTQMVRTSAAATMTAVVPEPLDFDDIASKTTTGEDVTVEGTQAGTPIFDQIINQRATYRWVAAPGGEVMIPATVNSGMTWVAFHPSYTLSHEVTVHFVD